MQKSRVLQLPTRNDWFGFVLPKWIKVTIIWIYRCWLFIWSTPSSLTNGVCVYSWWHNHIMAFCEADINCHLFESLWNSCTTWSKPRMCLVKIYDPAHSRKSAGYRWSKMKQQFYTKIMPHVLHRSMVVISKVTELSIFRRNSSIRMSFRKTVILTSNRYIQVTTWQICIKRHFQMQHSRSWYTVLECVGSKICHAQLRGRYWLEEVV